MRKLLKAAAIGTFVALFVPSAGWAAPPTGPQPLQDGPCNEGTVNARGNTPTEARDFVPHLHDFDADGVFACYHANPTYPPATPDLE